MKESVREPGQPAEREPEPAPSTPPGALPPEVVVQNPAGFRGIPRELLDDWLARLLGELAPGSGLVVRLTGDAEMAALNERYRGRPRTTDVLSFPGTGGPDEAYLGDVVISVPVARRQARDRRGDLERELKILMLHGVLHCLGYDHESDDGTMERLELELRRRWVEGDG